MKDGTKSREEVQIEFRRDLNVFDATMIGVGAMIGAGIFVLTGIAAGQAGPAAILAFLLNGIVTLFTALSYAELGSTIPEAGGGYSYIEKALPRPFGFISGWMLWFAYVTACSLYAIGFGSYFEEAFAFSAITGLPKELLVKVFGAGVSIIFITINVIGAETTGKTENILTISKIVLLMVFVAFSLAFIWKEPKTMDNLFPFFPRGISGIVIAMGLTFIAFEGYDLISTVGEEVKEPKKSIPKAIFYSWAVVIAIYLMVVFVSVATTNWTTLGEKKETALVEVASASIPYVGAMVMIAGGLLSTMSALNATTLSSSRVSFAMGRDGYLPKKFGKIHPVRRTPYYSILISGAIIIFIVVALPLETVAAGTSLLFLLTFALVNMSAIALRLKMPDAERGFKIPLFPIPPILGIITNVGLAVFLYNFSPASWAVAGIWIVIGLYLHYFYGGREKIEEGEVPEILRKKREIPETKSVVVSVATTDHAPHAKIGAIIAEDMSTDLVLMNIYEVPKNLSVRSVRFRDVRENMKILEDMRAVIKEEIDVRQRLLISHKVSGAIIETAEEENASLLILGWRGASRRRGGWIYGSNLDPVIKNAKCDIAVLKADGMTEELKKITVIADAEKHAELALKVAISIAKKYGAKIEILAIYLRDAEKSLAKRIAMEMSQICEENDLSSYVNVIKKKDVVEAVVQEVEDSDMLIMGASDVSTLGKSMFGHLQDAVAKRARCPVMVVSKRSEK